MQIILGVASTSALVTMLMMSFGKKVDTPLKQCKTANCLYDKIVKNKSKNKKSYTFDSCKSFDGKLSSRSRPNRDDMGKLCRLYVARKLAATRSSERCLTVNSVKPDYDEAVPEHALWVYSNLLYKGLPKELQLVKKLPRSEYQNKVANNAYVLSKFANFKEKYKVKKVIKRKHRRTRTRLVRKSNVRKVAFDVYYCVTNKENPRYIPYFYSLSMTPSRIGGENTEKKLSAKELYTLKYLKYEYVKSLPEKDAKVIAQLSKAKLKQRYMDYQLIDFDGDGEKDIVFLDDEFKKYRPGVCLFKAGKDACKVVLPKRYSQSGIISRELYIAAKPKKGIEVIVIDKQYNSNRETFKYVFAKGGLRRSR